MFYDMKSSQQKSELNIILKLTIIFQRYKMQIFPFSALFSKILSKPLTYFITLNHDPCW